MAGMTAEFGLTAAQAERWRVLVRKWKNGNAPRSKKLSAAEQDEARALWARRIGPDWWAMPMKFTPENRLAARYALEHHESSYVWWMDIGMKSHAQHLISECERRGIPEFDATE